MTKLIGLALTNLLMISVAWAATFVPVPMERLVQPADVIIMGDYLTKKFVELEDGTIATEARFKLEREIGLDAAEFGLTEVKVYYPGGVLKDRGTYVDGAPEFVPGEKSVVLLAQGSDGRLWVQGMAMGTFKLVKVGQKTLMINSVFPSNPELSAWEVGKFLRLVSSVKQDGLREVQSDKYLREMEKERIRPRTSSAGGNSRSIASDGASQDNGAEPNVMSSFWLLALFGALGALFTWWRRGNVR